MMVNIVYYKPWDTKAILCPLCGKPYEWEKDSEWIYSQKLDSLLCLGCKELILGKITADIVLRLKGQMEYRKMSIKDGVPLTSSEIFILTNLIYLDIITEQEATSIFKYRLDEIILDNNNPLTHVLNIIKEFGFHNKVSGEQLLLQVNKVLREEIKIVGEYKSGNKKVVNCLLGKILKGSGPGTKPKTVLEILKEQLEKL